MAGSLQLIEEQLVCPRLPEGGVRLLVTPGFLKRRVTIKALRQGAANVAPVAGDETFQVDVPGPAPGGGRGAYPGTGRRRRQPEGRICLDLGVEVKR